MKIVFLTHEVIVKFHFAMHLFSNRSQMMSNGGKKKVAHEAQPSVSLMFLPHFDVFCDLLLNRWTTTWDIFVLCHKEKNLLMASMHLYSDRS